MATNCTLSREDIDLLNTQINHELSACYTYRCLSSYCSQSDVSWPGLAKFFTKASKEEDVHAQQFIDYMVNRKEPIEYFLIMNNSSKMDGSVGTYISYLGGAHIMENRILAHLSTIHQGTQDIGLQDFLEPFIAEQHVAMTELSNMLTRAGRCTTLFELFQYDQELLKTV